MLSLLTRMQNNLTMIDINDITHAESVIKTTDTEATVEKNFTRRQKELRLRISEQKYLQKAHELKECQQNTTLRKIYISRNFILTCIWLTIVLAIVVFQGFGISHFKLDDSILITLLSTATANIIGVLVIAITYLFKDHQK